MNEAPRGVGALTRSERRRRGWRKIDPKALYMRMAQDLREGRVKRGGHSVLHIEHDDWCPCAPGKQGLMDCTCREVFYRVETVT